MLTCGTQITSFYGQTQFQNRFGTFNEAAGHNIITAPWQSGLSNSSLVGQLAGLCVNAYLQDRLGCRPTMMIFMTWMAVMIFIPVFAPSLSILAWGEAMCGVSWGVFQVSPDLCFCTVPGNNLSYSDALHGIRCRGCPRRSKTLCHRLCLHVLGCRYSPLIWCRPSRSRPQWRSRMATPLCPPMGLANSPLHWCLPRS